MQRAVLTVLSHKVAVCAHDASKSRSRALLSYLCHTMSGQPRSGLAQISGNACARRQLSKADRNRVYGALDAGVMPSDVAGRLGFNFSTVWTTQLRRSIRPPDGDVKPRSGRPKKLSDRDERILLRTVRLDPKLTYLSAFQAARSWN